MGILSKLIGVGIFIEQVGRRNELAMYMLHKFLESTPVYFGKIKRDRLFQIKFGHHLLLALTMGITSFVYNTDVGSIKTSILFLLDLVIGRDQGEAKEKEKSKSFPDLEQKDFNKLAGEAVAPQKIELLDEEEEFPEKESGVDQGLLILADSAEV